MKRRMCIMIFAFFFLLQSSFTNAQTKGELLQDLNLLTGDANGQLNEGDNLNRAELATILCRLNGADSVAKSFSNDMGYIDVSSDKWYAGYVNYAIDQGWLKGISSNQFDPNGIVTEEMVTTVLLRVLGYSPEWGKATAMARGLNIDTTVEKSETITRGEVFNYIYNSLSAQVVDGTKLYKKLVNIGALTTKNLEEIGIGDDYTEETTSEKLDGGVVSPEITDEHRDLLQEWVLSINFESSSWWNSLVEYSSREQLLGVFQFNNGLDVTKAMNSKTLALLTDKSLWKSEIRNIEISNAGINKVLSERWDIYPPYTPDEIGRISGLIITSDYNFTTMVDIDKLFNLDGIEIRDYTGSDLNELAKFKSLNKIVISNGYNGDLSFISEMKDLKTLHLNGLNLGNEIDLSGLTKLEYLGLNTNELTNLNSIKQLKNLEYLDVRWNKITTLNGIEDNKNLNTLLASDNEITDISSLGNLSNIVTVDLAINKISDINGLKNKDKMTSVKLNDNAISSISPLSNNGNMISVDLGSNMIVDLSSLNTTDTLKRLCLYNNPVEDISPILGNKNLEVLELGQTKISTIEGIKDLSYLTKLQLFDTEVQDITEIGYLSSLTFLNLPYHDVDMKPLTKLNNLDILTYCDKSLNIILNDKETLLDIIEFNEEISIYTDFYSQSNDMGEGDAMKISSSIFGDYNQIKSGEAEKNAMYLKSIYESFINEDMTDYEKVKAINDYVCDILSYDYENYYSGNYAKVDYSPLKVLETKKAVCSGYSRLVELFLGLADIEGRFVVGEIIDTSEDHAWNMVKLEDKWYHLDCTWNDTSYDLYKYFLVSQSEIKNIGNRKITSMNVPVSLENWNQ